MKRAFMILILLLMISVLFAEKIPKEQTGAECDAYIGEAGVTDICLIAKGAMIFLESENQILQFNDFVDQEYEKLLEVRKNLYDSAGLMTFFAQQSLEAYLKTITYDFNGFKFRIFLNVDDVLYTACIIKYNNSYVLCWV